MRRATDQADCRVFQTDRFFKANGLWYFATREGIDFGPFTIRADGEKAILRYIETQRIMRRLRNRDPNINDANRWDDQGVANAAQEVSSWRLDRGSRSDSKYSDRSTKHK